MAGKEKKQGDEVRTHVQAKFITSVAELRDFEKRGLPEAVLVGRSNVGKSSLINCVCERKKLARVSSAPGYTRLVNIYRINEAVHLVDLPGYGYARVSKEMLKTWAERVEGYLQNSGNIRLVLHIVDIRHEPSDEDAQMAAWVRAHGLAFRVIATKADLVSRDRMRYILPICRKLVVQPWEVIPFSSETGLGREAVIQAILGLAPEPETAP